MNKGIPQTVAYCLPTLSASSNCFTQFGSYTFIDALQYGVDILQTLCQLMPNVLVVEPDPSNHEQGAELIRRVRTWPKLPVKCVVILPERASWLTAFDQLDISGKVCSSHVQDELIDCLNRLTDGYRFTSPYLDEPPRGIPLPVSIKRDGLLTCRECEVVQLMALGYTNRDIAQQLFISVKTVESHKCNILQKLELGSASELRQLIRRDLPPGGGIPSVHLPKNQ